MFDFLKTMWNSLWHRSPAQAGNPQVPAQPVTSWPASPPLVTDQRIETYSETESLLGGGLSLGQIKHTHQAADGALVRSQDRLAIIVGCGHLVTQFQAIKQESRDVRGIAGPCGGCAAELQPLAASGQLSLIDYERLTLVCTESARRTVSGKLSCPRHCTPITQPNGETLYLGPEEIMDQRRRRYVSATLGRFLDLFLEVPSDPHKKDGENV